MRFTALLVGLVSASLSTANPLEKRQLGGILICNGADATGTCTHEVYEMDRCYNMTDQFYENAATFAPDGEPFYCFPYIMPCGGICTSPEGCTLGAVDFNYKNKYNLTVTGWDHYISSFECHRNTTSGTE